ncbi:MAG TPA: hypothetical protein VHD60_04545 [Candidatus Saccharimonadales bacterium]|nr:hypothetical protein [Candidatus Saccharimonadales bacterium]
MAATVCPSVTATTPDEYRAQLERVTGFAGRIHLDVADGKFTPRPLIDLDKIWWPANVAADLHIMYQRPFEHVELIKTLHPQLVIVHAEADGDFISFATELHNHGMQAGVALLPETPAEVLKGALDYVDHVLIFSGTLGQFGGTADLTLLDKARRIREYKPTVEIGWDGGVSEHNIGQLVQAGVDVLNVGGHIHQAPDPRESYNTLKTLAEQRS